tara:strand:+ start:1921 stop:2487 length:567 start_codon:yes stop_codon:yes gene_type:complete
MASKVLSCDKCEDSTNTFILHQNLRYSFKNTDVQISKGLGYCHDCESLRVIEDFDNFAHHIKQIHECSRLAIKKARRFLWVNFSPKMMKWNASPAQELTSHAYFLAIALKRKGDERCLSCLSSNITKFNGDMNLHYGMAGCYEGRKRTGFYHPGCGGEYIVSGSEIRFILSREPSYFNIDDDWQITEV